MIDDNDDHAIQKSVNYLDISNENAHVANAKSSRFPNCHRMVRVAANRQSRERGASFELPDIVNMTAGAKLLQPLAAI